MAGEVIVLAGGGTGGHLFPGLAVAEELRRRAPDRRVVVVGTGRPVERRAVAAAGHELRLLLARPLRGRGLGDRLLSVASLPVGLAQAVRLLAGLGPAAVVGLGGYASGPVVLAAAVLRIPTAVMEQNSVPGSANRLLARLRAVDRAYLSFASSARCFADESVRVLGNPVRAELRRARGAPLPDRPAVLVLGGSQGARSLNLGVPEALARVAARLPGLSVTHQAGEAMAEEVGRRYEELGLAAEVLPFVDDMASAYRNASLVVGRAGATTLAELTVVGRPALLVPYPHAVDDHQSKNAEELARVGAAVVVADREATAERLSAVAGELLADTEGLARMAEAALAAGSPDAAERVADDLEELIRVQR